MEYPLSVIEVRPIRLPMSQEQGTHGQQNLVAQVGPRMPIMGIHKKSAHLLLAVTARQKWREAVSQCKRQYKNIAQPWCDYLGVTIILDRQRMEFVRVDEIVHASWRTDNLGVKWASLVNNPPHIKFNSVDSWNIAAGYFTLDCKRRNRCLEETRDAFWGNRALLSATFLLCSWWILFRYAQG